MQAAMAALAEAQSTASALTYTNPGVLHQANPLAALLANNNWLTSIPNIQQLLTQLPASSSQQQQQQPLWGISSEPAAPAPRLPAGASSSQAPPEADGAHQQPVVQPPTGPLAQVCCTYQCIAVSCLQMH